MDLREKAGNAIQVDFSTLRQILAFALKDVAFGQISKRFTATKSDSSPAHV